MTYSLFVALFLLLPLIVLVVLLHRQLARARLGALAVMAAIALIYTTPWDNYLVASGAWTYDPARVWGLTLGWVPLEEYLFFVLQPLMVGMLYYWSSERLPSPGEAPVNIRWQALFVCLALWLLSLGLLLADLGAARYLALILAWGLPPLALQLVFGADLLWSRRLPALSVWAGASLYLIAADIAAINSGIWSISSQQTLGWNPLPGLVFEEAIFFIMTNALVIGGVVLLEHPQALPRARRLLTRARTQFASRGQ